MAITDLSARWLVLFRRTDGSCPDGTVGAIKRCADAMADELIALRAEVERLRGIEEAAKAWRLDHTERTDERTVTLDLLDSILEGCGPEGKVKP